jgi:hypothetical protein
MTDRVMVDIETLGTEPGCAILSIGAVRFDGGQLGDTFYETISAQSCQNKGLSIDAGTLEWWLDQDEEAQDVLSGGLGLAWALAEFANWYDDADEIWANSPSFDCEILAAAYDAVDKDVPWDFWQERDFRTLKNLPVAPEIEHSGVEHDALDDAKHQAHVAASTLKRLESASSDADKSNYTREGPQNE